MFYKLNDANLQLSLLRLRNPFQLISEKFRFFSLTNIRYLSTLRNLKTSKLIHPLTPLMYNIAHRVRESRGLS